MRTKGRNRAKEESKRYGVGGGFLRRSGIHFIFLEIAERTAALHLQRIILRVQTFSLHAKDGGWGEIEMPTIRYSILSANVAVKETTIPLQRTDNKQRS